MVLQPRPESSRWPEHRGDDRFSIRVVPARSSVIATKGLAPRPDGPAGLPANSWARTGAPAVEVSGGFLRVSSDAFLGARNVVKKSKYSGITLEANGKVSPVTGRPKVRCVTAEAALSSGRGSTGARSAAVPSVPWLARDSPHGADHEAAALALLLRLSEGPYVPRKSAIRLARTRLASDSSNSVSDLNATYQSVVTQIQEVNKEADDSWDFLCKAFQILESTVAMTIVLFILMAIPLLMVTFGVKDLLNCPKEPFIPIYLLVGGSFGALKLFTLLWRQIRSRTSSNEMTPALHHPRERVTFDSGRTVVLTDALLSTFLVVWFGFGNYWTWSAWEPEYAVLLHEPSSWCDRTLYLFTVAHIVVCYALFLAFLILSGCLCCCRQVCCYHDRMTKSARAGLSMRTPV